MKNFITIAVLTILVAFIATSCEKDVTLDIGDVEDKLVVEGYILEGETPFVMLTKSIKNGETINFQTIFDSLFVRGAIVTVTDQSGTTITLAETTMNQLTNTQKATLPEQFLINPIALSFLPVYLDTSNTIIGMVNGSYSINIEYNNEIVTGQTTIPSLSPLDSLSFEKKQDFDSLYTVFVHLGLSGSGNNYVRYLSRRNSEAFYPPGASGANWSDATFQGASYLKLPIERGYPSNYGDVELDELGAFVLGDTVTVMWNNIDRDTYLFWSSIDADGGDTPFSSPVKALSNLEGNALGSFLGYNQTFYTIIIE